MQQGEYVADVIEPPAARASRRRGRSATGTRGAWRRSAGSRRWPTWLGSGSAGFLAWLAWLFIHILYLVRFENRVLVLFQWAWNYFTRNRAARLITGERAIDGTAVRQEAVTNPPATKSPAPASRPRRRVDGRENPSRDR